MNATRTLIVIAVISLFLLAPGIAFAQTPTPSVTPPPLGPPTPTSTPSAVPPLLTSPDRLRNMTYPSEYSPSKQVTLVDGKVEWNEPPLRGNTVYVNAAISRDFAAVLLGSSTGGSGSFTTLHLVTGSGAMPTAGPGVFIGDRTRVESIRLVGGERIQLDLTTQGPTDPQCCPTQRETREYIRDGNIFRLTSTNITQPGGGPLNPPAGGAVTPPKTGNLGSADAVVADGVVASLALLTAFVVGAARRSTRGNARN